MLTEINSVNGSASFYTVGKKTLATLVEENGVMNLVLAIWDTQRSTENSLRLIAVYFSTLQWMSVSWTVVWIDAIHTWTNELRVMSCTGSCNRVIIMYLSPVPFTYFKSLLQLLSVLLFLLTRTIFAQIYKLHASSQWVQVELCVPVVGCIQMQAPNTFFF